MVRRMSYVAASGIQSRPASSYVYKNADVVLTESSDLQTPISSNDESLVLAAPIAHHGSLMMFTLMWGGNFVLAEIALRELSPISFSVARFLVAGFAMLAILYVQGRLNARSSGEPFRLFPAIDRADLPRLCGVSILGATLAPWLGIEGLYLTSGGRASLWLALCPVLSAGMGYVLKTESMRKIGVIGLLIAGLGTIGLAADGLKSGQNYWAGRPLIISSDMLHSG